MIKITSVQLQKNLVGIEYPANKQQMIRTAEEKGADEQILRALNQLPNQEYKTPTAVSQALAAIELKPRISSDV